MADGVESLTERARRKRIEAGTLKPEDEPKFDPALIPEGSTEARPDDELDKFIDSINVVDAYNRWADKPKITKVRDGENKWHCPLPNHPDGEPSMSIDTKKNVWNCYVCQQGGDVYDLAAIKFGYPLDGYKSKTLFPKLKLEIAADYGFTVVRSSFSGTTTLEKRETPGHVGSTESSSSSTSHLPPVVSIPTALTEETEARANEVFRIDWRSILPENTFIRRWCEIASLDDLPEEFHFWLAMQMVGLSVGRSCYLNDHPAVYGNFFITLIGPSGMGKSRASTQAVEFMREALPFDESRITGTKIISSPGSAEALLDAFAYSVADDPTDPKSPRTPIPIRGLLRIDEFATLAGRAARAGSVMKPTIQEFFDTQNTRITLSTRGTGEVVAVDPLCSIISTTQPRSLASIFAMSDADSGFLNRWIFARGVPKKLRAIQSDPPSFDECVGLLQGIRAWASSKEKIQWTPEGRQHYTTLFEKLLIPHKMSDDAMASRIDLMLKKVIFVFALDQHKEGITAEIVDQAFGLYEYLAASWSTVGLSLGKGELEQVINDIEAILFKWLTSGVRAKATARDIKRSTAIGTRYSADQITKALDIMVKLGMVDRLEEPVARGAGTVRYALVAETA